MISENVGICLASGCPAGDRCRKVVAVLHSHHERARHVFAVGSGLAIGIARLTAAHDGATCLDAYETLVEKDRTPNGYAGPAAVFASDNREFVVTMVDVRGFDGFRLAAAWDDYHRDAQQRGAAESISFASYEVAAVIGAADFDPATRDVYVYERVKRPVQPVAELFASLMSSSDFRGAAIFKGQGDTALAILSRFSYVATYDAFRAGRAAVNALGSAAELREPPVVAHPRETSALF